VPSEVGEHLTIEDVVRVARERAEVALSPHARERVTRSRAMVEQLVRDGRVVYGITTGVGELAGVHISPQQSAMLQVNIVRSHSAGVGDPLPEEVVRAMMLLRAHTLALGYSGIRLETLTLLLEMLNRGLHPVIPSQGSVGASGDLAPLAHLALALIGEGEVVVTGRRMPSRDALASAGLSPAVLTAKEGVALINGTQAMTAIGALAVFDARRLATSADISGGMSFEALRGLPDAFDPLLQRVRPHPGHGASADNLRRLIAGSEILAQPRTDGKVQDAYALRCMPQVHGASRDAIAYAGTVIDVEMNAATDNPLIFPEGTSVSGGNFHAQALAMALDHVALGMAVLAGFSERRIARLVDTRLSELPPFLTQKSGLNSGMMIVQYVAAGYASDNKVLAHPASADSIPTSANQEDFVPMGMAAALKARQSLENAAQVVALEVLAAAQGLEFLKPLQPGVGPRAAHEFVRSGVAPLVDDRSLAPDANRILEWMATGELLKAVEAAAGRLA